jgi:hypothetical protein
VVAARQEGESGDVMKGGRRSFVAAPDKQTAEVTSGVEEGGGQQKVPTFDGMTAETDGHS